MADLTAAQLYLEKALSLIKKMSNSSSEDYDSEGVVLSLDRYYRCAFMVYFQIAQQYKVNNNYTEALIALRTARRALQKSSMQRNFRFQGIIHHHLGKICAKLDHEAESKRYFRDAIAYYQKAGNLDTEIEKIQNSQSGRDLTEIYSAQSKLIFHLDTNLLSVEELSTTKNFDTNYFSTVIFFSDSTEIFDVYLNINAIDTGLKINQLVLQYLEKNDQRLFGFQIFADHPMDIAKEIELLLKRDTIFQNIICHVILINKPRSYFFDFKKLSKGLSRLNRIIIRQLRSKKIETLALVSSVGNSPPHLSTLVSNSTIGSMVGLVCYRANPSNNANLAVNNYNLLIQLYGEIYETNSIHPFCNNLAKLCSENATALFKYAKEANPLFLWSLSYAAIHLYTITESIYERVGDQTSATRTSASIGLCYLCLHKNNSNTATENTFLPLAREYLLKSNIYYKEIDKPILIDKPGEIAKSMISEAKEIIQQQKPSLKQLRQAIKLVAKAKEFLEKINHAPYELPCLECDALHEQYNLTLFRVSYKVGMANKKHKHDIDAFVHFKNAKAALLKTEERENYHYLGIICHHMGILSHHINDKFEVNEHLCEASKYYELAEMNKELCKVNQLIFRCEIATKFDEEAQKCHKDILFEYWHNNWKRRDYARFFYIHDQLSGGKKDSFIQSFAK